MLTSSTTAALAAVLAIGLGAGTQPALAGITGSGSTFANAAFTTFCKDTGACTYIPKGSTGGIADLANGVVDFAGTDAILTPDQRAAVTSRGGPPLYFPVLLGAVTVPANVRGVSRRLKLTGPTLAGIFDGEITSWDDRRIVATNPGMALPHAPITVCVRADGSGTSFNFSRYLTKVSASFKAKVGFSQTPAWTAPRIARQNGNPGIVSCLDGVANSIGYVDLPDAAGAGLLPKVAAIGRSQVVQARGRTVRKTVFVLPSSASVSAAGRLAAGALKPDLTLDLSASPAPGAYPLATTTWALTYSDYAKAGKSGSLGDLRRFLTYVYGAAAQSRLAGLGYAPLPPQVLSAGRAQLSKLV
jgi:phosphate transport system substrate-binding protein